MPQNHLKFHSTNGKRRILIVEDEMINREILAHLFQDAYNVVFAQTGAQAIEIIGEQHEMLSLVQSRRLKGITDAFIETFLEDVYSGS